MRTFVTHFESHVRGPWVPSYTRYQVTLLRNVFCDDTKVELLRFAAECGVEMDTRKRQEFPAPRRRKWRLNLC